MFTTEISVKSRRVDKERDLLIYTPVSRDWRVDSHIDDSLFNIPKTCQQRCEINIIYVVATLCIDTTPQQRCVNVVYDTTLPQLRCNVVVALCVSWVVTQI